MFLSGLFGLAIKQYHKKNILFIFSMKFYQQLSKAIAERFRSSSDIEN